MSVTETRGLIGTPLYMSPEQAQEHNLDARTDLWNLGVIYYELPTGLAPFRADSSIAVLRAITDEAPVPLRHLRPDVPPLCEQIVSHALEKNPGSPVPVSYGGRSRHVERCYPGSAPRLWIRKGRRSEQTASYTSQLQFPFFSRSQQASGFSIAHIASTGRAKKQFHKSRACSPKTGLGLFFADKPDTCRGGATAQANPRGKLYPHLDHLVALRGNGSDSGLPCAGFPLAQSRYDAPGKSPHSKRIFSLESFEARQRRNNGCTADRNQNGCLHSVRPNSRPTGWCSRQAAAGDGLSISSVVYGPYKLPPFYVDRYEVTNREYQKFVDSHGIRKERVLERRVYA